MRRKPTTLNYELIETLREDGKPWREIQDQMEYEGTAKELANVYNKHQRQTAAAFHSWTRSPWPKPTQDPNNKRSWRNYRTGAWVIPR